MNATEAAYLHGPVTAYKAEVIADASGKWVSNGLVFRTEAGARAYVDDLARRWTLVRDTRVVPVEVETSDITHD